MGGCDCLVLPRGRQCSLPAPLNENLLVVRDEGGLAEERVGFEVLAAHSVVELTAVVAEEDGSHRRGHVREFNPYVGPVRERSLGPPRNIGAVNVIGGIQPCSGSWCDRVSFR